MIDTKRCVACAQTFEILWDDDAMSFDFGVEDSDDENIIHSQDDQHVTCCPFCGDDVEEV